MLTTNTDDAPGQILLRLNDTLRLLTGGVAALVVVSFHFMEMVIGDYSKLFIGQGLLAVDFFTRAAYLVRVFYDIPVRGFCGPGCGLECCGGQL